MVNEASIDLELRTEGIIPFLIDGESENASLVTLASQLTKPNPIVLAQPYTPARRGSELRLVLPPDQTDNVEPNPSVLKALARAYVWRQRIIAGEIRSKEQLAQECNLSPRYVARILELAVLSPRLVEAVVAGAPEAELPLNHFLGRMPLSWEDQEARIRLVAGLPRSA